MAGKERTRTPNDPTTRITPMRPDPRGIGRVPVSTYVSPPSATTPALARVPRVQALAPPRPERAVSLIPWWMLLLLAAIICALAIPSLGTTAQHRQTPTPTRTISQPQASLPQHTTYHPMVAPPVFSIPPCQPSLQVIPIEERPPVANCAPIPQMIVPGQRGCMAFWRMRPLDTPYWHDSAEDAPSGGYQEIPPGSYDCPVFQSTLTIDPPALYVFPSTRSLHGRAPRSDLAARLQQLQQFLVAHSLPGQSTGGSTSNTLTTHADSFQPSH